MRCCTIARLFAFSLVLLAARADAKPAAAVPTLPPACTAPQYRQFDFWLGSWNVTTPDGKPAGTNVITREVGGCVLHEHWVGVRGMRGESFNTYDAARKLWHQTWVDDRGLLLTLEGRLENGSMVLVGRRPATNGAGGEQLNRITWTPGTDGSVRQLWEQSSDDGTTWTTGFDGHYVRAR